MKTKRTNSQAINVTAAQQQDNNNRTRYSTCTSETFTVQPCMFYSHALKLTTDVSERVTVRSDQRRTKRKVILEVTHFLTGARRRRREKKSKKSSNFM